jgi:hypothetical protein
LRVRIQRIGVLARERRVVMIREAVRVRPSIMMAVSDLELAQ